MLTTARRNTEPANGAMGRPIEELPERPLLWWRVPERPGVGAAMLINSAVWLVSIIALFALIGLVS